MNLTLKVWRQKNASDAGRFETYHAKDVLDDMSFLEMLDVVNEGLIAGGLEPIAFDSDCREGICGMCSLVINGIPHGGHRGTATCQLHMRHFKDGETITMHAFKGSIREFAVLSYGPVVSDLTSLKSPCAWTKIPKAIAYLENERQLINKAGDDGSSLRGYLLSNDENFVSKGCPSPRKVLGEETK